MHRLLQANVVEGALLDAYAIDVLRLMRPAA
jgi:hypothetical protein